MAKLKIKRPDYWIEYLRYTKPYMFSVKSPFPRPKTMKEVEVEDSRIAFDVETKELIEKYWLEPYISVVLNVPMSYNREKQVYELMEEPNVMQADSYFYYYPATPTALTTAGWYNARVDEYMRVLGHVEQVDQISGTLTTDANNYLQTHVIQNDQISGTLTTDANNYLQTHVISNDQISGTLTTDSNNYLETHSKLVDQLPSNLTGNGNLKISLQEDNLNYKGRESYQVGSGNLWIIPDQVRHINRLWIYGSTTPVTLEWTGGLRNDYRFRTESTEHYWSGVNINPPVEGAPSLTNVDDMVLDFITTRENKSLSGSPSAPLGSITSGALSNTKDETLGNSVTIEAAAGGGEAEYIMDFGKFYTFYGLTLEEVDVTNNDSTYDTTWEYAYYGTDNQWHEVEPQGSIPQGTCTCFSKQTIFKGLTFSKIRFYIQTDSSSTSTSDLTVYEVIGWA